jgi:hypothetical protein
MNNLGLNLEDKFKVQGRSEDLEEAQALFVQIAKTVNCSSIFRILAAYKAGLLFSAQFKWALQPRAFEMQ